MWRMFAMTTLLLLSSACGLAPNASAPLSDTVTLLSDQVPNPRAFGDPNAPVKITEFSDFQ